MTQMNSRLGQFSQKQGRILLAWQVLVFIIYVIARVFSTLPALHAPRELADTAIYVRISTQPILSSNFLQVNRPFVFPLLLKVVGQDFERAAMVQLALTIFSWGSLAFVTAQSLRPAWLSVFSFVVILALSLVRHLAGWDFAMMTESLSLSTFALLIATGIWLLHGWRIHKVVLLCITAFLFAFTRDTNAYLLLMFAALLLIGVLFRWVAANVLVIAAVFGLIFLISNLSADTSARWIFPMVNVVGKRILPYSAAIRQFESCGMPVTPQLLKLADSFANGEDRAFFNDPSLETFRLWLAARGKSCYVQWLLMNPVKSSAEALAEFNQLIFFDNIGAYFSRRYSDLLPSRVERILYPVYHVTWLWAGLTLAALAAIFARAWRTNSLWVVFIMLCLTIFPHLFITWHGDAMAPNRHAVSVGMQLAVAMWLFVFLSLEQAAGYFGRQRSDQ